MVGGMINLKPDTGPLLQYAATTSFLSKLYIDYLMCEVIYRTTILLISFSLAGHW